jgi:hypothetical protein
VRQSAAPERERRRVAEKLKCVCSLVWGHDE